MTLYDVNAVKAQAPDLLMLAEQMVPLKRKSSINGGEYTGPCPFCNEGENRFNVQPNHPVEPRWLCRYCTGGKWRDVISFVESRDRVGFKDACQILFGDNVVTISPEEVEKLQQERFEKAKAIRAEEIKKERTVQQRLNDQRVWEPFYNELKNNKGALELWKKNGIQGDWVDYYKVGYCPERKFKNSQTDEFFTSPTLTMPYWKSEEQCVGMVHRLLIENPPGGKYRPHFAGAGKVLFRADLTFGTGMFPNVLVVEGEKKAMVTYSQIWRSDPIASHPLYNFSVVGLPGMKFKEEWVSEFADAAKVWIALDPDATGQSEKLSELLGKDRCFIVELPDKIDDLFLMNALDKDILWQYLKGARK